MPTNLTAAETFAGEVKVPDEGEEITAVTDGIGKGPVRPGYQALLNKIWSLVRGKVSVRALLADGAGGAAVNPPDGSITASAVVLAGTGILSAAGDIIAAAGRVQAAIGHRTFTAAGRCDMDQRGVRWDTIAPGDANGPNPSKNEGLKNEVRAINTCKAWAHIFTDGANGFVLRDGANILAVLLEADGVIVLFTQPMLDANYSVVAFGSHSFTTTEADMAAGQVKVRSPVNPKTTSILLTIQVYGRQQS